MTLEFRVYVLVYILLSQTIVFSPAVRVKSFGLSAVNKLIGLC